MRARSFFTRSAPDWKRKKSPVPRVPPDFFTILRVCMPSVWNASVRCQEFFSSQHVHKNRRISRRCRLLPVAVSNSVVRVPPGNVNSTRPINFASRLFARSTARPLRIFYVHLFARALFLPPALFPLTHAFKRSVIRFPVDSPASTVVLSIFFPVRDLDLSPVVVHAVIAVSSFLFHAAYRRGGDARVRFSYHLQPRRSRDRSVARKHQKHRIRTEQMKVLLSAAR